MDKEMKDEEGLFGRFDAWSQPDSAAFHMDLEKEPVWELDRESIDDNYQNESQNPLIERLFGDDNFGFGTGAHQNHREFMEIPAVGRLPINDQDIKEEKVVDFFKKGLNYKGDIKQEAQAVPSQESEEKTNPNKNSTDNASKVDDSASGETPSYKYFYREFGDAEKDDRRKDAMVKRREKKRIQKMNERKRMVKEEVSSRTSEPNSTKKASIDDESVSPQKRKGTIWKILFPNKKSEKQGTDLERLVCRQVEAQISKDPKVIKSYNDLEKFENSEEAKNLSKSEYTKKKNRISAQLSRERREAILHSLMNVCLENIKAKIELDEDIDEAKDIIKSAICEDCSTNLKSISKSSNPKSTLNKKAAGSFSPKKAPVKQNPAISISRVGTLGIIMSIAVFACIAAVSLVPSDNNYRVITMAKLPDKSVSNPIEMNIPKRRFLSSTQNQNALAIPNESYDIIDEPDLSEKLRMLKENYGNGIIESSSLKNGNIKVIPIYKRGSRNE